MKKRGFGEDAEFPLLFKGKRSYLIKKTVFMKFLPDILSGFFQYIF